MLRSFLFLFVAYYDGLNFPACTGMQVWISPYEVMFQMNMKHLQLSLAPLMGIECILGFSINANKYSTINNQMKFSHIDVLLPLSLSEVLTG